VLQGTLEHVAEDLHVAVRVRREALAAAHAVLVDHAQRAEAHVLVVVVVGEAERVPAVEPAVVGATALVGAADREAHRFSSVRVVRVHALGEARAGEPADRGRAASEKGTSLHVANNASARPTFPMPSGAGRHADRL
jgi:hypothetical protein